MHYAKEEGIDPREELKQLVLSNQSALNRDQIRVATPNRKIDSDDDWFEEYVKTTNPYDVLQKGFYQNRLRSMAIRRKLKNINESSEDLEVVEAMLDDLGFKKKVEPEGLFQIQKKFESYIENDDLKEIAILMEELLGKLFLFYSYLFFQEPNTPNATINEIERLLKSYRKKSTKSLGNLYAWLKELMELVQNDAVLTNYCQNHFQREVPLNPSQIGEIGMFRTYRNLLSHRPDADSWNTHQTRAHTDFSNMDDETRKDWEGSWNNVIEMYESQPDLPKNEIAQRMVEFFKGFLNSLSENQIYPKVIVMRSYTVDDYGTHRISAVDDTDETIFLTDCKFKTFTFTELYYHSRTNPTGIEPILVPKEELEDWGT